MVSEVLAHPWIEPAANAVRRLALHQLRASWRGGRLDLVMPTGETVRIGDAGTGETRARIGEGRAFVGDAGPAARISDAGPAEARAYLHDDRVFLRLALRGELGAGESFVAGEWSSDDLVGLLRVALRATAARGVESPLTRIAQLPALVRYRRRRDRAERNVHAHYDLGNRFYRLFLDETLTYSCAIWPSPNMSLADAQRAKLDRMCDWLELAPRDHLLEIGCGWGSMAIHAAKTRGCRVTAITLSREQHELASARVAAEGLADRVAVQYRDYRDVTGRFDKIVSIEMLEQVGDAHLPTFFATCARALAPGGLLAVQTITMPDDRFETYRRRVDWMQTYVFPGTLIPSLAAIRAACAPLSIARSDDIGPDYAPTLRAWRERYVAALPDVRALGFDTRFIRTWLLYLAFSEAAFSERTLGDHQLLFVR